MTVHDRGLRAVARVRSVREQDSRIGLQKATQTRTDREASLASAQQRLAAHTGLTFGTPAEFAATAAAGAARVDAVRQAQAALDTARTIVVDAHARWQADRGRLRAAELLLERRAERRAEETARKEAAELDDLATQRWQRSATGPGAEVAREHPHDTTHQPEPTSGHPTDNRLDQRGDA